MAGSPNNVPQSFGDESWQEAFIVRLQNHEHLAPKVKADRKMSEDDLSHNAANLLATITGLHGAEIHHSQLQKLETSSTTTTASEKLALKNHPDPTGSVVFSNFTSLLLSQLQQLNHSPTASTQSTLWPKTILPRW